MNLSPCVMPPWTSLSPPAYKDDLICPASPDGANYLGSPGEDGGLGALSPAVSPFSYPGAQLGAFLKGGDFFRGGDATNLPPTLIPTEEEQSASLNSTTLNIIYHPKGEAEDQSDEETTQSLGDANHHGNALQGDNDNEQPEVDPSRDETGDPVDPDCATPKKTLTTLESIKISPITPIHGFSNATSSNGLPGQLGSHQPESLSPMFLNGGTSPTANGYSPAGPYNGLSNGYSVGMPNGLCGGYPSMATQGNGGGYGGFPTQGPGVYSLGYGPSPINRSCALSGGSYSGTQGMPLGTASPVTAASPLVDLSPPSLSPISPTSFSTTPPGSSCMYSGGSWRWPLPGGGGGSPGRWSLPAGGGGGGGSPGGPGGLVPSSIPAVAAAASGITGASLSPSPGTSTHPFASYPTSDIVSTSQVCVCVCVCV